MSGFICEHIMSALVLAENNKSSYNISKETDNRIQHTLYQRFLTGIMIEHS